MNFWHCITWRICEGCKLINWINKISPILSHWQPDQYLRFAEIMQMYFFGHWNMNTIPAFLIWISQFHLLGSILDSTVRYCRSSKRNLQEILKTDVGRLKKDRRHYMYNITKGISSNLIIHIWGFYWISKRKKWRVWILTYFSSVARGFL
jgi:hypothetical protein